jgi:hypothetical protein
VGLAVAALAAALGACSPAASDAPSTTGASSPSTPVALTSPVEGVPIDIEAEGFSNVAAFTIRTLDGREITFAVGTLENGAEFPPNHLAEHLAGSTPVRVYFRREGGENVVYRLEDGEPVP